MIGKIVEARKQRVAGLNSFNRAVLFQGERGKKWRSGMGAGVAGDERNRGKVKNKRRNATGENREREKQRDCSSKPDRNGLALGTC